VANALTKRHQRDPPLGPVERRGGNGFTGVRSTTEAGTALAVPRPESLRNVRIGLVENTKYNSDKLLLRIAAILEKEYGAQSHIIRSKHGSGVPAHK
jgi:hypothetical protein